MHDDSRDPHHRQLTPASGVAAMPDPSPDAHADASGAPDADCDCEDCASGQPCSCADCSDRGESRSVRSFMQFLDGMSDATILVSRDQRVVYANSEARLRFGSLPLGSDMHLRKMLRLAFPAARAESVTESLKILFSLPEPEPATVLLTDGTREHLLRLSILEFDPDCHCGTLDSLAAVTFSDPDYDALVRHLDTLLNATSDGIFIRNRANRIIYFNKACERLTGWKRGEAVLETYECSNVLQCHNEAGESMGSEALCPAKVYFRDDKAIPKPEEMLITTAGGKERWVETTYSPIRTPNGELEFVVGIMRDVDERKRLEDQIVQNRNLAMLGTLVSGIAHEIKNPLGVLMSAVEVVLNERRTKDQRLEAAGFIKEEVRRLDERMKYFLAFAKPKAMHCAETDVNAVLRKVAASYRSLRNPRFQVETELCPATPPIQADADLLHQVFLNLIINADQAMPNGGRLTIYSEVLPEAIRIRFVDQGPGIREQHLPRLFEPFFTTKSDGTGLGLSIVHQILTKHRGRITVRNNSPDPNAPGAPTGATFEITLPRDGAEPTES
jgi:signal transduction histidine kinase